MPDSLALTVTVPADAWDACNRRVVYLETLLVGIADRHGLDPEWFDVERLAGLWGRQAAAQDNAAPVVSHVVIPAWVLPLFRLMNGPAGGNLASAWEMLPGPSAGGHGAPGDRDGHRHVARARAGLTRRAALPAIEARAGRHGRRGLRCS